MGVNSLPKTVTWQRHDCSLNPGPSAPESSMLTTRLPSQPIIYCIEKLFQRKTFENKRILPAVCTFLLILQHQNTEGTFCYVVNIPFCASAHPVYGTGGIMFFFWLPDLCVPTCMRLLVLLQRDSVDSLLSTFSCVYNSNLWHLFVTVLYHESEWTQQSVLTSSKRHKLMTQMMIHVFADRGSRREELCSCWTYGPAYGSRQLQLLVLLIILLMLSK